MFLDKLTLICNGQAFDADAVSESSYDLGDTTPVNDIGEGTGMAVGIAVNVAADHTTGNETFQFELIQSDAADLGSPDVLMSMPFVYTELTVGQCKKFPIPGGKITKRYLGIQHNGTGTTPTVTVDAWIGPSDMISTYPPKYYPKGYTVS